MKFTARPRGRVGANRVWIGRVWKQTDSCHAVLRLVLLGLLTIGPLQAQASAQDAPKPVHVENPGEQNRLIFSDGREAGLFGGLTTPFAFQIKIDLTENACFPQARLAHCTLTGSMQFSRFRLAWTKHPDPTRLGKTLVFAAYKNFQLATFTQISSVYLSFEPELFNALKPFELTCDDFAWATATTSATAKASVGAPSQLFMTAWNSEYMLPNSESGLAENSSAWGAFGLRFEKSGPQSLRLGSVSQWLAADTEFVPFALVGQAASWILPDPNGSTCQVSTVMDFGAFEASAGAHANDPVVEAPSVSGRDRLWEVMPMLNRSSLYFNNLPAESELE